MAKTTTGKAQRHAREAIDEASTALARAKKATASLSAKQARRLDDYVGDARSAVDVSADEALVAELTSSGAVEAAGPVEAARDAPVAEEPAAASERTDLAALTVVELRARARAEDRTGYSRLTKSQLIDLLS